jgi:tRNA(Ser,Leu) C12 N-acetylase TAN1
MPTTRRRRIVMTQQNEEHFETIDQNKAEQHERQKIKFLEDRIKVLEKSIESHAKILARFQMTEDKDNNEMPEWVTTTGKMRNV